MKTGMLSQDTEILLLEYASGVLPSQLSLLMASYVSMSAAAMAYVRSCEQIGGMFLEHDCRPVAMQKNSLKQVLARLENTDQGGQNVSSGVSGADAFDCGLPDSCLPLPLRRHLQRPEQAIRWKKMLPGMAYLPLSFSDDSLSVYMLKVAPGIKTPRHRHPGMELTLVLDGAFHDENGHYAAGDLIILQDDHDHQPIADDRQGCICIVASDHPAHFTGTLTRFLNFLMR